MLKVYGYLHHERIIGVNAEGVIITQINSRLVATESSLIQ